MRPEGAQALFLRSCVHYWDFSAGETIEKAITMAQEAAECHIEGMLMDAEPIPTPTDIEKHRENPDYLSGHPQNPVESGFFGSKKFSL